jgi:predicted short-subunit dehydrogenase-like oxidoreductase (DUF2520 family)
MTAARKSSRSKRPARKPKQRVGFIGAGRAGSAFAWHCHRLGFPIAGICDQDPKRAWVAYGLLKLPYERLKTSELVSRCDVLFLTVPDRHIEPEFLAVRRWLRPRALVVHCSGVLGTEVFKGADEHRLETLGCHPIQSFSSHAQAITSLPGTFFALEGTPAGMRFGRRLARLLKGGHVEVRGPDRPLYHAMCVFASNFQNGLLDAAETLAARLGISRRQAAKMLAPLMKTVADNLVKYGAVASLTGPVQRGDDGTIAQHLEALRSREPGLVPLYRDLSLRLADIAGRQGADAAGLERVRRALEETRTRRRKKRSGRSGR